MRFRAPFTDLIVVLLRAHCSFHLCGIAQSINQISYFVEGLNIMQFLIRHTKNDMVLVLLLLNASA